MILRTITPLFLVLTWMLTCTAASNLCADQAASIKPQKIPPNIVLIITDDQGYGDLGFTGNSVIQTPAIDQLRRQSVLLDNFHVDPTCAPTRAALLTGRYSNRTGVWHTIKGRSMLREREITLADILTENGYATGLFGKWHLGDCYPYRPQDRGFTHSVYHLAGGVGQAPDYWGNDYFDDTYLVNGKFQRFEGFCTDIWFGEGIKFIEKQVRKEQPFFAYISTNAPHSPFYCPEEFTRPYEGVPDVSRTEFYGMVTNIDSNIAKLMERLDALGVTEDTILIFMTDNGTAGGLWQGRGYDGGMRGRKNSAYEGGHRVPCLIRWPGGNIQAGAAVEKLSAHFDLLPTLIDLLDLEAPSVDFDGTSLRDLLYPSQSVWKERTLVVESQRVVDPIKWRKCAVMSERWRLINGQELYDRTVDPKQATDVAAKYPNVVGDLRTAYEAYWADVSREHVLTSSIVVGSDLAPIVALSSHDWLLEQQTPWNQPHIKNGEHAHKAHWAIDVEQAGMYELSLRRWPVEADKGINDGTYGRAFNFSQASVRIGANDMLQAIPKGAKEVTFTVHLEKGPTELAPIFIGSDFEATPYYVYVTHQPFENWQTPEGMGVPIYDPNYGSAPPQLKK